ncbi:isoprenylcysteine carboxylmethyltransferase family protein [Roseovarius sp. THAF9]|uniref:methyltransferase family protein n=1 Tax=Roseovarius sp. THAF9 TaxID=2587847 RepID=UPI001C12C30B
MLIGAVVHSIFAIAVVSMIVGMFFGMSRAFGSVPALWHWLANAALLLQFPLAHSLLLNGRGPRIVARIVPGQYGGTLATSTFAIIASLQLAALFLLWTPSGIVWWQPDGAIFAALCTAYAASWLLLIKASIDAGAEVQSGALGWMSMLQEIKPRYPDMPRTGLFRIIRQPIYVSFALTTWTVPVWTPDQLLLASVFTAYCLLAPVLKERRFRARYGAKFDAYQAKVPYAVPRFTAGSPAPNPSSRDHG